MPGAPGKRPYILLDVDGVLNVTGSSAVRSHKCFHDGWRQAKAWAFGSGPYRIFYNPAIGRPIMDLARDTGAELAWATMWEEYANSGISPLFGLPQDLPVSPARSGIYKADAVVPWTAGRPFVLFEDEPEEISRYLNLTTETGQACLLLLISEYEGLTEAHISLARSWLLAGPWKATREENEMPQETAPQPVDGFAIGDTVEHRLMPGFHMPVIDKKPCEPYAVHPSEHPQYEVAGPEGDREWVCHYDVQAPGANLPFGVPE